MDTYKSILVKFIAIFMPIFAWEHFPIIFVDEWIRNTLMIFFALFIAIAVYFAREKWDSDFGTIITAVVATAIWMGTTHLFLLKITPHQKWVPVLVWGVVIFGIWIGYMIAPMFRPPNLPRPSR